MKRFAPMVVLWVVLWVVTACTSKDGARIADGGEDAQEDAPSACTSNTDCPEKGTACGYAIADGCTVKGQCINLIGGATGCAINTTVFWCGCDGKTFPAPCDGYPNGFISTPVAHPGACAGDPVVPDAQADGHIPTCIHEADTIAACPSGGRELYYCEQGARNFPADCTASGLDEHYCCK